MQLEESRIKYLTRWRLKQTFDVANALRLAQKSLLALNDDFHQLSAHGIDAQIQLIVDLKNGIDAEKYERRKNRYLANIGYHVEGAFMSSFRECFQRLDGR